MNTLRKITVAMLAIGMCSLSTLSSAGEEGLTDLQNAKVAYQLAKQRQLEAQKTKEEREDDSGQEQKCGAVDIGNVSNQRGARGPREVITVVKGDVINVTGPGGCR